MNDHESAAMWRLYQLNNQGIAIQTTVSRLNESLDWDKFGWEMIDEVHQGKVNYLSEPPIVVSPEVKELLTDTVALFCKLPSFEHEREYRIVIEGTQGVGRRMEGSGLAIPIAPKTLIENVFVAPTAPSWIRSLLQSILQKKYDLTVEVSQSSLDEKTLW